MCPEIECSHKSLTRACNVLSWECVSLQLPTIKGTNNLHVAALSEHDMWSVNPFSSRRTMFSHSRDGAEGGGLGRGGEKQGERKF